MPELNLVDLIETVFHLCMNAMHGQNYPVEIIADAAWRVRSQHLLWENTYSLYLVQRLSP